MHVDKKTFSVTKCFDDDETRSLENKRLCRMARRETVLLKNSFLHLPFIYYFLRLNEFLKSMTREKRNNGAGLEEEACAKISGEKKK